MTAKKRSTCSYCGVGCGIRVWTDRHGRLQVEGDPDHPVNRGMLCSKGMTLHYTMRERSDRLLYPEMRWGRSHPMARVTWETAMTRAAAVFASIIDRYGPDSVGFYVSGQCLTEEYYLANKLVKGFLGTNNIDTNSRLCMSSAVSAYQRTFGEDSVPNCYDDIELADCFFIAGANPAWCHPILFQRIEQHKEKNPNVRIIVADPRRTASCEAADLHLPLRPGTDLYLFGALARVLIEEERIDRDFLSAHVDGYEQYRDSVMATSVEDAASICGVEVDDIRKAARWIGDSKGFLSLWAMGLNQSAIGVRKNLALMSLNLITGQVGRPGCGPFSLTGQPNAMGGREVGGMCSLLPAHRDLTNPRHRKEVAKFWGVKEIPAAPGYSATAMFDAMLEGKLKAVWIIGTNPMVSLPDVNRAERALATAKFVVVQEISRNADTLRFADLILPAAGHFEKEGTMTNSERRITHLDRVVDPPGEALPDTEILIRFAKAMGFRGFDFLSVAEIFEEHANLTEGTRIDISGLTHEGLKTAGGGVQWPLRGKPGSPRSETLPVVNAGPSGTPRLFTDRVFFTPTGKARLYSIGDPENVSMPPSPDFPLVLTTGRIRDQWHTMTKTGKVRRLSMHIPKPFLEIHPEDAASRGIVDGDPIRVVNDRGEVRVRAVVTDEVRIGTVFLPMHWGRMGEETHARANNLTSGLIDPISKEPDLKFAAVQVSRVPLVRERVVVIGAGAAAYRFVHAYRALNLKAEIHVFSGEADHFYDRVRLPEYVAGEAEWDELLKYEKGEIERLDLHLHAGTRVVSIDREERLVTDDQGETHSYDRLIVATGSRAFVPPGAPVGEPGILTMRNRRDAESLRESIGEGGHVLIVGGGLLGLELAASLVAGGIHVTIVEAGGRLMERQLDPLAGELLMDFVEEKGIHVHLNDQVQGVRSEGEGAGRNLWVLLRSGRYIRADAVVYSVGTRPNSELLSEAGVACGRGVLVNDRLQSSDPAIYAIGEIAEHRGRLHGITLAAEEQALVAARHLAGDPGAIYEGSVGVNILKFSGMTLCSIGLPSIPPGEKGYEEIVLLDRADRFYKKCIVRDDRLVGAILMGGREEFQEFRDLIAQGTELSERRHELLRGGPPREPIEGKVVCSCVQVGEGNLVRRIVAGCHDLESLMADSGAGTGCGSCRGELRRLLEVQIPAGVA